MYDRLRLMVAGALVIAGTSACGGHDSKTPANRADVGTTATPGAAPTSAMPADSAPGTHHSKLGGALVGAAVGHVLGGHAVAGAAAGAMVQHARNKQQ